MQAFIAPPMRRGRSTVVISICTPPFADRCIASLRCSRPTPGFFARFLSAAAGQRDGRRRAPYRSGRHLHPFHLRKFAAQSATLELGKVMPFGANDLSLFAAADAAIRAWIADAPLPPRDKAPVDYFLVEESIIKREGNLRLISRQTLKTSPRSRQGMRSPARQRNVGWCRPGPLYPLSQRRGRHRPARRAVAPRR